MDEDQGVEEGERGAVGVEGGLDTVVGVGRAKTRNDALNQYVRH